MKEQRRWLLIGLAIVFAVIAFNEWVNPSLVKPDGRWSFMYSWAWDRWGSSGVVGFFSLEAVVLFALSFFSRGK